MDLGQTYWLILGGMLGGAIVSVIVSLWRQAAASKQEIGWRPRNVVRANWWANWWQGISTEMVGALVTTSLLVLAVGAVQQRQLIAQQKQELILQMGSPNNAFAIEAWRILRARGWGFEDDTTLHRAWLVQANLQGADLQGANLQAVNLAEANLQETNLWDANLQGANLNGANLQGAQLMDANLQRVYLKWANLQGANLRDANLQGVNLWDAILQGADLWGTNLQGVNLEEARFYETTTLPDGSKWTFGTDLTRFADPAHPDFWQGYGLGGEDLRNRDFRQANLRGADLQGANLEGADLGGANLQGAVLWGANLQEANLTNTQFDESTILPDCSVWAPDTDITRFTDPNHPDFWRSDNPGSPAYRDRDDD